MLVQQLQRKMGSKRPGVEIVIHLSVKLCSELVVNSPRKNHVGKIVLSRRLLESSNEDL